MRERAGGWSMHKGTEEGNEAQRTRTPAEDTI